MARHGGQGTRCPRNPNRRRRLAECTESRRRWVRSGVHLEGKCGREYRLSGSLGSQGARSRRGRKKRHCGSARRGRTMGCRQPRDAPRGLFRWRPSRLALGSRTNFGSRRTAEPAPRDSELLGVSLDVTDLLSGNHPNVAAQGWPPESSSGRRRPAGSRPSTTMCRQRPPCALCIPCWMTWSPSHTRKGWLRSI